MIINIKIIITLEWDGESKSAVAALRDNYRHVLKLLVSVDF